MSQQLNGASKPQPMPPTRKNPRVALDAEIIMRRAGFSNYRVLVHDLSVEGCKVAFVDRPTLDEKVWVKFAGLEALQGIVCWVKGTEAGVKFQRSIHPAVFEMLLKRLAQLTQD